MRILFENGYGDPTKPGAPIAAFEHSFSQWPPKETVPTTWYFQPDQQLTSTPPTIPDGDGRAGDELRVRPDREADDRLHGFVERHLGREPDLRLAPAPAAATRLAFDGPRAPPRRDDGRVPASVDLWLRSTAPDTDLEVTLTELRPDGQERYVQSGWLRASHRKLDPAMTTKLRPWHTDTAERRGAAARRASS